MCRGKNQTRVFRNQGASSLRVSCPLYSSFLDYIYHLASLIPLLVVHLLPDEGIAHLLEYSVGAVMQTLPGSPTVIEDEAKFLLVSSRYEIRPLSENARQQRT